MHYEFGDRVQTRLASSSGPTPVPIVESSPQHSLLGRMIPDAFLHLFSPSRRLNVHPSLYRGSAPIQHTITDCQEETGVAISEMREKRYGADVGDIWAQKVFVSDHTAFVLSCI